MNYATKKVILTYKGELIIIYTGHITKLHTHLQNKNALLFEEMSFPTIKFSLNTKHAAQIS